MKKILKSIAFLSLAMCLMLNTNVVHATKDSRCPRDTYSGPPTFWKNEKGTDFRTEYYDHDILEIWASADKEKRDRWAKYATEAGAVVGGAAGTVLTAESGPFAVIGKRVGAAAGGLIGGFVATAFVNSWKTDGEKWLEESMKNQYCGVKLHVYRTPIGTWIYYSFEPQ